MSGSVANPTGSVKGISCTGLVDAYTGNWGGSNTPIGSTRAQFQHAVLLSSVTGACTREGSGGSYAANEVTLRLTMTGYADLPNNAPTSPPAGDLPVTFQADGTWLITSDGVHRQLKPYFMKARSNGGAGADVAATGGTVTFTRMDSTAYEGSYDLNFNGDHITGSFVAPWC